jgi:hypothetical protein
VYAGTVNDAVGGIDAVDMSVTYAVDSGGQRIAVTALALRPGGSVAAGDLSEALADLPVGAAPDIVHVVPEMALSALHEQGFTTVATHPEGNLAPEDLASLPRVALILGNEHDGIRDALHDGAKQSVRIPMRGFVESFNVSVAAAVLLYAATRGREGDLPEAEQLRFYARALVRSVPRSLEVLAASGKPG